MKPFVSLLAVLVVANFVSCSSSRKTAQEQEPVNRVQNAVVKGITIDGNDADWQGVELNSSPEKSFQYSVAHDDEDLFVRMKIANPVEQMKFLSGGMELWIDPTGQEKQQVEVIYPVKGELASTAMQPQNTTGDKKQNREMMHLNIRASVVSMDRVGFKPEYSGTQTISQNTGFKGAINWNDADELIYELKVPLKAFNGTVSSNHMDIEFSIGALERPTQSHSGGENSGGFTHGGMNGGMRGGGYGGQGRYGGQRNGQGRNGNNEQSRTDWQKLREKESFWVACS